MKTFFTTTVALLFCSICCADEAPTPVQNDQAAADQAAYQRSSQAADALRDLSKSQLSAGNTAGAKMATSRSNVAQTKAIIARDKAEDADQNTDQNNAASK